MGKKNILLIILIIFINIITFSPSIQNNLTNWDDLDYVTENILIKELTWKNIIDIFNFLNPASNLHVKSLYTPLVILSYAIEYHFFGNNPEGYHITNLVIHIINCLLVFWIILLITRDNMTSFLVSILFAIHPLHVESVVWITERKDLLYSLFFLGTIISYIYYKNTKRLPYYYMSLVLFLLSLLSKPMGVTLPVILLLFDYIMSGNIYNKKNIKEKIPYLLLTSIFIAITLIISSFYKPSEGKVPYPFSHNIFIASYNIIFYLYKLSWPTKQSAIYPHPEGNSLPLFFLISPFIVLIFITVVILSVRYTKKISFAILFFLITILPVIQLIPVPPGISADRYTYIPSIGYFYILSEMFVWIYRKKTNTRLKTLLIILLIFIIITLSLLSYKRTLVWRDSITLWSDVLKNYPEVWLAWNNRGIAYLEKNDYDRAIDDFNHSIKLDPGNGETYYNLGNAYYKKQEYDKSLKNFNLALRLNNSHIKAYINRGNLYYKTGNYELALSDFNKALTLAPYSYIAYTARGNVYFDKKEYKKSLSDYNQSLKIAPDFAETYNNRGMLYGVIKEYDKAIEDFTMAVTINPVFIEAYYNRAITWSHKKEYDKAWEDIEKIQKLGYQVDKQFMQKHDKELKK